MNYLKKYISFPNRTVDFCVQSNDTVIIEALSLLYGKFVIDVSVRKSFDIVINKLNDNEYEMNYNSIRIVSSNPVQNISNILFENPNFDSECIAIHGGAIEYCGKAYLFIAPTMGGKSTLISYLISKGMGYISEDCILINKKDLSIVPYTSPIHIRQGGKTVLEKYGIHNNYFKYINHDVMRYIFTPNKCIDKNISINSMYFFSRSETINQINLINKYALIEKLLKSVITTYRIDGSYLKTIMTLANNSCYNLYYRDMEFVYRTIIKEFGC